MLHDKLIALYLLGYTPVIIVILFFYLRVYSLYSKTFKSGNIHKIWIGQLVSAYATYTFLCLSIKSVQSVPELKELLVIVTHLMICLFIYIAHYKSKEIYGDACKRVLQNNKKRLALETLAVAFLVTIFKLIR